ncbi:hypothetical protein HAX54_016025 [Datura stramonium]|uniref:Uncharacterized protein n=1 Tax=Datura stramonium TaxID=4076 RepID=A0ABS8S331_DATST|nr:hypothetical protein [Datura stramonium]
MPDILVPGLRDYLCIWPFINDFVTGRYSVLMSGFLGMYQFPLILRATAFHPMDLMASFLHLQLIHALKALSKALAEEELIYLRAQFNLLEPKAGCVSLDNFRMVLGRLCGHMLITFNALVNDNLGEGIEDNIVLEMNLGPTAYTFLKDCIRPSDRKLSFLGYTKFLHGVTPWFKHKTPSITFRRTRQRKT